MRKVALTGVGVLFGVLAAGLVGWTAGSARTVQAYEATRCGPAATTRYVSKAQVDSIPNGNIIFVLVDGVWQCHTVDRSVIHLVETTRPCTDAEVKSCASCVDTASRRSCCSS